MCFHGLRDNDVFHARNGCQVGIQKGKGGEWTATVLKTTDRKFPIGTQVTYKNSMGHVLCKGHSDRVCDLHPLDAVRVTMAWFQPGEVASLVKEALRRRRYNKVRTKRNAESRDYAMA